jgi:hypothetical protein
MAKIPIISYNVEEINYFINFFVSHISEYGLSELTNGYCGDIPSIQSVHPLALEYANMLNADSNGNFTSILPAIGVELLNDNESGQQFLGSGYKFEEITEDQIDSMEDVSLKNRFSNGFLISDTNITTLKSMKVTKGSEKLWKKKMTYLQDINLAISIWSDNYQITRMLYIITRDMLKRIKHEISVLGVKNLKISGQGNLYNFEFNTTLFGGEFNVNFINQHYQEEVDDSLSSINHVNESILGTIDCKPIFKPIGGE